MWHTPSQVKDYGPVLLHVASLMFCHTNFARIGIRFIEEFSRIQYLSICVTMV